jgi:choline dehydrogenase
MTSKAHSLEPMHFDTTYDVVVVGGGSAGCVMASRLTEAPDLSLCLIEAGPRDRNS